MGGGASGSSGFGNTGNVAPQIIAQNCGNSVPDPGEACDDGNTQTGDGCTRACQLEADYSCPTPGQPCVYNSACGDGKLSGSEACDDGNTVSGDGCAADCSVVDPGWQCRAPGRRCTPWCGDGIITPPENCDGGNNLPNDGCSVTCLIEPGWSCDPVNQICAQASCGNGVPEAGEACDAGPNNGLFYGDGSGCSKTCTREPVCRDASGVTGACATSCGDGNIDVNAGETCEDGNAVPGDGCSELCQAEAGFTCTTQDLLDTQPCSSGVGECLTLPITYRDFEGQNVTGGHPDFFFLGASTASGRTLCVPNASGTPAAVSSTCSSTDATGPCLGLVQPTLNAQGKPQLAGTSGQCACRFTDWDSKTLITAANGTSCTDDGGNTRYRIGYSTPLMVTVIQSPQSFAQWYTDDPSVNTTVRGALELAPTAEGTYRFSSSGGLTVYEDIHAACLAGKSGSLTSGFFPLEDQPKSKVCNVWPYWMFGSTDACCAGAACKVLGQWDASASWNNCPTLGTGGFVPSDTGVGGTITGFQRNFYFTSEVRYLFRYTQPGTLSFYGDDDVWVFVNGQLALDLGATHERIEGSVVVNETFGLVPGNTYEIVVFHADRHPRESNYQLTLSGFSTQKTSCAPTCGDGVATVGEECDEGAANSDGAYGGCTTACLYGPFCGDGVVDPEEQCDMGRENGPVYGQSGCSSACTNAHMCGDAVIDSAFDEECDDGPMNGVGALCDTKCKLKPM